MFIRKATENDIDELLRIYDYARKFMVNNRNTTQWENGYPGEKILRQDIINGDSYVCIINKQIVGTFSFIVGDEPTYQVIKQGKWQYDRSYGTIHRLASSRIERGVSKACFDYCRSKIDYIRIDTHKNNRQMQSAIRKYGFKECGIIYVRNGSERIAFDYLNEIR